MNDAKEDKVCIKFYIWYGKILNNFRLIFKGENLIVSSKINF